MAGATNFGGRRGRWVWRVLLGGFGLFVVATILALLLSVLRPAWYRPLAIDYASLSIDKRDLVGLYDQISAALNGQRAIEIEISDQQFNRWLAAHREFWPKLDSLFAGIEGPLVRFLPDEAEFAATVTRSGWPTVVSGRVRGRIEGDLLVEPSRISVGRLSAPAWLLWPSVAEHVAANAPARVKVEKRGGAVFNEWLWENGRVPFQVSKVVIEPGTLRIEFSPLQKNRT